MNNKTIYYWKLFFKKINNCYNNSFLVEQQNNIKEIKRTVKTH
jgi:hypothetical protein